MGDTLRRSINVKLSITSCGSIEREFNKFFRPSARRRRRWRMLPTQRAQLAIFPPGIHIATYLSWAEYVLAFKWGCYWIMNVLKRPKFRLRGEHYFRQRSNNFVRFYIIVPGLHGAPSSTCATCWKVHTFDRCNTYDLRDRSATSHICCFLRNFPRHSWKQPLTSVYVARKTQKLNKITIDYYSYIQDWPIAVECKKNNRLLLLAKRRWLNWNDFYSKGIM